MLRRNKTSRSPLVDHAPTSSNTNGGPLDGTSSSSSSPTTTTATPIPTGPYASTSPTINLTQPPWPAESSNSKGNSAPGLTSSGSFYGLNRYLGGSGESKGSAPGSGSGPSTGNGMNNGNVQGQGIISTSSSSSSGWKFSWFGGGQKAREKEKGRERERERERIGSIDSLKPPLPEKGGRSPKMSKDAISGPSNFVHHQYLLPQQPQGSYYPQSHNSSRQLLVPSETLSPKSPESPGLYPSLASSPGSSTGGPSSPARGFGRRATVGASEDREGYGVGMGEVPPVPPLPPRKDSWSELGVVDSQVPPRRSESRNGLSPLGSVGKKPWSRSVDDFSKILGLEKKPKHKVLLGGFGSSIQEKHLSGVSSLGSPALPSSASMMSFPLKLGGESSASTPTQDLSFRPHTPVASVPIASEASIPLSKKKSREIVGQLTRSMTRESLSMGNALGFVLDSPTDGARSTSLTPAQMEKEEHARKKGLRRKTNSFSSKMLLDVVSSANLLKGGSKSTNTTPDENLPRSQERKVSGGKGPGKASSPPMMLYGFGSTERDGHNSKSSERETGHARSQSFNILGGIGLVGKSARERNRSGNMFLNSTTDTTADTGGIIRTPSGSDKRTSQMIHKEGFLLKHAVGGIRSGRSGRAPSPTVIKGLGDDYFSFKTNHDTAKGWKPHKAVLKGAKLHFYKPPSDKRAAIEGLFPTTIISDSPVLDSPTGSSSPKTNRKPVQRAFWGTTKHPELKICPEFPSGHPSRIVEGCIEALAHELVFATQFDSVESLAGDEHEMRPFELFAWCVLLSYRVDSSPDVLFGELDKCLQRAIDLNASTLEDLTNRLEILLTLIQTRFVRDCFGPDGRILESLESLLQTCEQLQGDAIWMVIVKLRQHSRAQDEPLEDIMSPSRQVTELAEHDLSNVSVDLLTDALSRLYHQQYGLLEKRILQGKAGPDEIDDLLSVNLFFFEQSLFNRLSAWVLEDLLHGEKTPSLDDRTARLERWVAIAEGCQQQNNIAAFVAIAQALYSLPVLRLSGLWKQLPARSKRVIGSWQALASGQESGSLPFHSPTYSASGETGNVLPYLGTKAPRFKSSPTMHACLPDWKVVAHAFQSIGEYCGSDNSFEIDALDILLKQKILGTVERSTTGHQWMEVSCQIQPPIPAKASSRSWSKAEGRNRTAIQPLLFVHPLPISSLADDVESAPDVVMSPILETRTAKLNASALSPRPSIRSARRASLPSRPTSCIENSSLKSHELEASRSDTLGTAIRGIRGQLRNATIRITEEIELQLVETDGSSPSHRTSMYTETTISRRPSQIRTSIALKRQSIASTSNGRLAVTIKSASTERLVDVLVCGIEGDSLGADDNGQLPLHVGAGRKFALDLIYYRQVFFASYRTFMEPSILFEYLRKRFYRAKDAHCFESDDIPSAALQWLMGSTETTKEFKGSSALARYIRMRVVELLGIWLKTGNMVEDLLDDADLLSRMQNFVLESHCDNLSTRTADEQSVILQIKQWWQELVHKLVTAHAQPELSMPEHATAAPDWSNHPADLSLPENGDGLLFVLEGFGNAIFAPIRPFDLHTACTIIERHSKDPLAWYSCDAQSRRNRAERHLIEITSPNQHFRQRLGAPTRGAQPYFRSLPSTVQKAFEQFDAVKRWLIRGLTSSDTSNAQRVSILNSMLEALGRANRPEYSDRLDKRASIASLAAAMSGSNSTVTVPSFAASVICETLLHPSCRLQPQVWLEASRTLHGRPDDLAVLLNSATLRFATISTATGTPDLAWLIRSLAEVVWSFPDSQDFMVDFEKQRHLVDIINIASSSYSTQNMEDINLATLDLETLIRNTTSIDFTSETFPRPTGFDLTLHETFFGRLISEEATKQDREKQTVVTLLRSRGEAKARVAYKEMELNAIMSKSTYQKPIKAKKHASDAFWWTRPLSSPTNQLTASLSQGLPRSPRSLEFKTPKESTLTLNLAGCNAKTMSSAVRSFVFEISTPEGLRHIVQAKDRQELDSWIDTINKASEMAMIRRKTFVAPTIVEVAEPLPSSIATVPRLTLEEELDRNYGMYRSADAIPRGAEACMEEIERRALMEPGLYRIPGSSSRVDALLRSLVADEIPDLSASQFLDPSTITSALKKWLALLPESVVTDKCYDDFILAEKISERNDRLYAIRGIIWALPPANFALLKRIIHHLDLVNDHEEENQMTPRNLATCLAPTLFFPSQSYGGRAAAMTSIGHAINLIDTMICQKFWLFNDFETADGITSAPSSPMPVTDGFDTPMETPFLLVQGDTVEELITN